MLIVVAATTVAAFSYWRGGDLGQRQADDRFETISDKKNFQIRVEPEMGKIDVGPIHSWLVHVADRDGAPVMGAEITLDGGMPAHGHGLPTVPEMTDELGEGTYRIDGVKFSMIGHWVLTVTVQSAQHLDSAHFELTID